MYFSIVKSTKFLGKLFVAEKFMFEKSTFIRKVIICHRHWKIWTNYKLVHSCHLYYSAVWNKTFELTYLSLLNYYFSLRFNKIWKLHLPVMQLIKNRYFSRDFQRDLVQILLKLNFKIWLLVLWQIQLCYRSTEHEEKNPKNTTTVFSHNL